ncbi:MAG: 1-acyl-sn-glycerol-3-phosphate acyltransferase [Betaproteobacteria bacterium]|nr:1-acyl-sn-glycerol-3-phosphate acyltransferase [Betaproteobacteria bacterium]
MPKELRALLRIIFILHTSLVLNLVLLLLPGLVDARSRVTSFFFRIILWGCGIQIQSSLPFTSSALKKRILIVANHVSYLDILIICAIHPCIFLAKSEVAKWPVFGWVARALGCVFVERESLMGRACALRRCLTIQKNSSIAIFPEGTTTAATVPDMQAWSRGHAWIAQRAEMEAILCLGLVFENQPERAWTDDTSLMPHLFRTLSEKQIRVSVHGTWTPVGSHQRPQSLAQATLQGVCLAVNNAHSR